MGPGWRRGLSMASANVLPSGYQQYAFQIAGHKPTDVGKESLGVVEEAESGRLLKPMQSKGRGEVERSFYEEVGAHHRTLAAFLPAYHGTRTLVVNDKEATFLVLENLTAPFARPCILDVKMGHVTWEPTASEEKKRREGAKYKWGRELKFRVLGLRVYDASSGSYVSKGKAYGRNLPPAEVPSMLELFFGGDERSRATVESLTAQLAGIQAWFALQSSYQIYSSSLLLIYEGDASKAVRTDVRMIDFAHIGRRREQDRNYLDGINSFLHHLTSFSHSLPTC